MNTPVALLLFKRHDKIVRIIEQLALVKPSRVYLLSDYGRDEAEIAQVEETRRVAETAITWDCEVIKFYQTENVGVYGNIALGAMRVFGQEETCIFLEDDNLPGEGFFDYCEQMLERYRNDERVLWICGTNYLSKEKMDKLRRKGKVGDYDAFFTQLNLPCGWASWSRKFLKYYDPELRLIDKKETLERLDKLDYYKPLKQRHLEAYLRVPQYIKTNPKQSSWDWQMQFVIRYYGLFGIMPFYNQINNIGDDEHTTHFGRNFLQTFMEKRLTNIATHRLPENIRLRDSHQVEPYLERRLEKYLMLPPFLRLSAKLYSKIKRFIKTILRLK